MDKIKEIYVPKWASYLYALLAIALVPWIILLAQYLPAKHLARHWDALWVGFDIIMLFNIFLTLYFVIHRKIWVIVSAASLATLFIVDAWFDVLTARPGSDERSSIGQAIIELTLSFLTFRLIYHIIHQSTDKKDIIIRRKK